MSRGTGRKVREPARGRRAGSIGDGVIRRERILLCIYPVDSEGEGGRHFGYHASKIYRTQAVRDFGHVVYVMFRPGLGVGKD